jgi:thioredoxin reductase (NADPH)
MSKERADVIVVGGGIAGGAAALRAVQYHLRVVWIRGDKRTAKQSRSQWVANIDNMIGLHDGVVRGQLRKQLSGEAREAFDDLHHVHIGGRDIIANTLERIESDYARFATIVDAAADGARRADDELVVSAGDVEYRASHVVLATGVMDRQPFIKKAKGDRIIDEPKWIYPFANRETVLYCIRCEGHLTAASKTAVIGSGEAAAQLGMMLHERYGSACSVLTNGEAPAWSDASAAVLAAYGIETHRERIVDVSGSRGELHAISLDGGGEVAVGFALVSLGLYRVYNDLARELGAELTDPDEPIEVRHVLIDRRGETSVANLFAVGDMARRADEPVMKQVYTAQEYAVRAVDSIDSRTRRKRRAAAVAAAASS